MPVEQFLFDLPQGELNWAYPAAFVSQASLES